MLYLFRESFSFPPTYKQVDDDSLNRAMLIMVIKEAEEHIIMLGSGHFSQN